MNEQTEETNRPQQTKTLSGQVIPLWVHTKIWDAKKAKGVTLNAMVSEILTQWAERDDHQTTFATDTDLETMKIRVDRIELQLSILLQSWQHRDKEKTKDDIFELSELLQMSWAKFKVLCMRYQVTGFKTREQGITMLQKHVTINHELKSILADPVHFCSICDTKGHLAEDCPQMEVNLCTHCGEKGHNEDECELKKEQDETPKPSLKPPCEKCGGFHRSKCKMA